MRILITGARAPVGLDRAATLPDEVLDYWGRIYAASPAIRAAGFTFEQFLARPGHLLQVYVLQRHCNLLPAQRLVRARAELRAA